MGKACASLPSFPRKIAAWGVALLTTPRQMKNVLGVEFQDTLSLEGPGVETQSSPLRCSLIRVDHHTTQTGQKGSERGVQSQPRVLMG